MTTISQLQKQFQSAVLGEGNKFLQAITVTEKCPNRIRLDVYRNAYRYRLILALGENYPGLLRLLGEDQFHELARAYMHHYPSKHYSIRWFGEDLYRYLKSVEQYRKNPSVVEMARLDWLHTLIFEAPDESPMSIAEMAAFPATVWPNLRFSVSASHHILNVKTNVVTFRQQTLDDKQTPDIPKELNQPLTWLFWRKDMQVHYRCLEEGEKAAFLAINEDKPFYEVCAETEKYHETEEVALQVATYLKSWIADQLILRAY